jgi:hypothetical protein
MAMLLAAARVGGNINKSTHKIAHVDWLYIL